MGEYSFILKRLGIFLACYLALSLLSSLSDVNRAHLSLFHKVGTPILNFVFPGAYIKMIHYEGEPMNKWDSSFQVYEQAKYPKSVWSKSYRKTVPAALTMHKGIKEMIVLPTLLLLALFLATPFNWKQRIRYFLISLLLLYLIGAIHISYNVKFTLLKGEYDPSTLWDYLVWIFGGAFTDEHFNIVALVLWLLFALTSGVYKQLISDTTAID